MNFLQAALLAFFYYNSASPWCIGMGFYIFGRALPLGFLTGLVLGDPVQGTIVGATVQLIYLGVMSTGGSFPADQALAGIVATAAAITGNLSAEAAVAVAVPVGLAGTVLYQIRMLTATLFAHMADQAADEGNVKKVSFANIWGPQILLFLVYFIPCFVICAFGVDAISGLINSLAETTFIRGLTVIGGYLAVIGIAMNMKAIFKGEAIPFFFAGFLMVAYLGLNLVAISCFAIIFALVYANLKTSPQPALAAEEDDDDE